MERTGKEQSRAGCSVLSHADGTPKRGVGGREDDEKTSPGFDTCRRKKCSLRFKLQSGDEKSCQLTPRPGVDATTAPSTWIKFSIGCLLRLPCCCPSEGSFLKVRTITWRCLSAVNAPPCLPRDRRRAETQFWPPHSSTAGQLCARCRRKLAWHFKRELRLHVGFVLLLGAPAGCARRQSPEQVCRRRRGGVWFTRPQVKAVHCLCLTLS